MQRLHRRLNVALHSALHSAGLLLTALAGGLLLAGCQATEPAGHDDVARSTGPAEASEPLGVDRDRNIYIPPREDLVQSLRVAVLYNDEDVQVRYEFETDDPSWYHQYWVRENGRWVRYGSADVGPDEHGLYEDRISMAFVDNGVEGFDRAGGFIVSHPGIRSRTDEVSEDEVTSHEHLGERLGESDVRKFIAESREGDLDDGLWSRTRSPEELDRLRDEGRFVDTWQWRAHRSNPVGYADNGYVLDYRLSSEGDGPYTTNWDDDADQPAYMFDPDVAGVYALNRDQLLNREYGQDDPYYLYEGNARPYDPDHGWRDGDVLPQRFLREPSGSRGALRADGRYEDGMWRLRVTRTLESPNPRDSHAIEPGNQYRAQFAVHTGQVGARWHHVSMPVTIGVEADGDIEAQYVEGDLDDAEVNHWVDLPIIYPGQVTWREFQEDGDPLLRSALERAVRNPTDEIPVRGLAHIIAQHEQELLRRRP